MDAQTTNPSQKKPWSNMLLLNMLINYVDLLVNQLFTMVVWNHFRKKNGLFQTWMLVQVE